MRQCKGLISLSVLAIALSSSAYANSNNMDQVDAFDASVSTTHYDAHQPFNSTPELSSSNHEPVYAESKLMFSTAARLALSHTPDVAKTPAAATAPEAASEAPNELVHVTQQTNLSELIEDDDAFVEHAEDVIKANPYDTASADVQAGEQAYVAEAETVSSDAAALESDLSNTSSGAAAAEEASEAPNELVDAAQQTKPLTMPELIEDNDAFVENAEDFIKANPYDTASSAVQAEETADVAEVKTVSSDAETLGDELQFEVAEYNNAIEPSFWDELGDDFEEAADDVDDVVSDATDLASDALDDMTGGLSSDVSSFIGSEVGSALGDVDLEGTAVGDAISTAAGAATDVAVGEAGGEFAPDAG